MWVIYHKEKRKVVGMSADGEPELDKDYALEEVVRGQVNAEAVNQYDALLVSDRAQARASMGTPFNRLVLREAPEGGCKSPLRNPSCPSCCSVATRQTCILSMVFPKSVLMALRSQPSRRRRWTSAGSHNKATAICAPTMALYSTRMARKEITSIKLRKGQAAFRLVSEKARRVATVQVLNGDANFQDGSIRIEFI